MKNDIYIVLTAGCTVTPDGQQIGPGAIDLVHPGAFYTEEEAQHQVNQMKKMGIPAWWMKTVTGKFTKKQMKEG